MARIQELTLNGSNRALLLIALVAGLVAAGIVFVALNDSDDGGGGSAGAGALSPVVVAAEDISVGATITADMVTVRELPEDLTIAGAFEATEPVVGNVARVAIARGEQINSAKIGVPVPDKGLAGVVPAGMRAVSLEVSEVTAVGGLLLPGDRVDVLGTYTIERAPGLAEDENILRTETILQNVEVLSVAQEKQEAAGRPQAGEGGAAADASGTSGQLPEDVEEQPGAGTITLALSLQDAERLANAQDHMDRVWLVLRPYGDSTIVDAPPHDTVIVDEN